MWLTCERKTTEPSCDHTSLIPPIAKDVHLVTENPILCILHHYQLEIKLQVLYITSSLHHYPLCGSRSWCIQPYFTGDDKWKESQNSVKDQLRWDACDALQHSVPYTPNPLSSWPRPTTWPSIKLVILLSVGHKIVASQTIACETTLDGQPDDHHAISLSFDTTRWRWVYFC